jgi:DNA-binding MarR family transcriptional regulator
LDPDVEELARLMMTWTGLSMKLQRGNAGAQAMAAAGFTLQQIVALHVLMFEGPSSVSHLTDRLGLSVSATSHLVQRLVEEGAVARVEDPADRRQKKVSLTASGRKVVERLMKQRMAEFKGSVQILSPALREDLIAVMQRVVMEMTAATAHLCGTERRGAGAGSSKTRASEDT